MQVLSYLHYGTLRGRDGKSILLAFVRFRNRSEKKAKSTQTQKLVVNHMLPVAHLERTSVILYVRRWSKRLWALFARQAPNSDWPMISFRISSQWFTSGRGIDWMRG